MRRKWRENEEMERDWLSTFPHSLSISSLFLHFLPLFPFPTSKCITFCCKMLNTALLSRMSQKSQHTRYEEIILGRTCCEEAPQFVPAWYKINYRTGIITRLWRVGLFDFGSGSGRVWPKSSGFGSGSGIGCTWLYWAVLGGIRLHWAVLGSGLWWGWFDESSDDSWGIYACIYVIQIFLAN